MPISVKCECGRSMQVKDEMAGKQGRCPSCGALVQVPVAELDAASYLLADSPDATPYRAEVAGDSPPPRVRNRSADEPASPRRREPERGDSAPPRRPDWARGGEDAGHKRRPALANDEPPRPKRKRSSGPAFTLSAGASGGLVTMAIGLIWFLVRFANNRISIWAGILFVMGLIGFLRALSGAEED